MQNRCSSDLERQNYNDTAVTSGLDKFLIWAAQTEGTLNKPSVLKNLATFWIKRLFTA